MKPMDFLSQYSEPEIVEAVRSTFYSSGTYVYSDDGVIVTNIGDLNRYDILHINLVDEATQSRFVANLRTLREMMFG